MEKRLSQASPGYHAGRRGQVRLPSRSDCPVMRTIAYRQNYVCRFGLCTDDMLFADWAVWDVSVLTNVLKQIMLFSNA